MNTKMNYIRGQEARGMSTINRDTEIIDVSTPKKSGTRTSHGNHTITNFHTVCVNPHNALGGIHDSEIEAVHQQAAEDFKSGWIRCATLGVEGSKGQRHAHLRQVIETPSETHVTKKRYEPLIDENRQVYLDQSGKKNITVHCGQPKKGERKHMRAFTHLAYPWKYMAQGYDSLNDFIQYFLKRDMKDTPKYRSYGLFDNGMDDEDKTCFATAIWRRWLKEKDKVIKYLIRWDEEDFNEQALQFMEDNDIPLNEWQPDVESQTKIITAMVLHKGNEKQYLLTRFFKKFPTLYGSLIVKKKSPDFEALVFSAVRKELTRVHGEKLTQLVPTKITSEKVKQLEAKVYKLDQENDEIYRKFKDYRLRSRKRKREADMEKCSECGLDTNGLGTSSICVKHWTSNYDSEDHDEEDFYRGYGD
jgi:hypothetical protein